MYTACRHIDHSDTYKETCKLVEIMDGEVKYWERQNLPYPEAPRNVQFCGLGRGRINNIFGCYGEMSCYEPIGAPAEPR